MLDRFPPEILLEILSWTRRYPTQSYYSICGHPNHTLCLCARVSRTIKAAAEKLIWRRVEIKRDNRAKEILAASKDRTRAGYVREMVVSSKQKNNSRMSMVIKAFPSLTSVSIEASFYSQWKLRKDEAAAIGESAGLRTLKLQSVELTTANLAALGTLSSLVHLVLRERCKVKIEDVASLLSAEKTPSLGTLQLAILRQPGGSDYFPTPSATLLSRIDRLRLSSSDFIRPTSNIAVPLPSDKTLFVLDHRQHESSVVSRLPAVNLALTSIDEGYNTWDGRERDPIAILQQPLPLLHASTTLKSIGIHMYIRERSVARSPSVAAAYSALLQAAEEQGVAVWWYEKDAFEGFGRYLKGSAGAASSIGDQ